MSAPTNLTPEQQAQLASLLNQFQTANEPPRVKTPDEQLDEVEAHLAAIAGDTLPFDDQVAVVVLKALKALREKYG